VRTEFTLTALVDHLQSNCGDMLDACRRVGLSLIFVNQWRKDDKRVNEKLLEAERVGTQGLVSEAIRRGAVGHDEDVYFKGIVVGTRKVFSDGLLTTLLKAKVPEFAKDADGANVNVHVNVANIMPRAENYDAWLAMKHSTLASSTTQQLPAPVEAEYTEVKSAFEGVSL
jgi:hypothetical protein